VVAGELGSGEANVVDIDPTQCGEGLDDELVVDALGQSRHGDRADAADAVHHDRKAPAVAGHIAVGESHQLEHRPTVAVGLEADRVRRPVQQLHDVAFATGPVGVCR